MIEKFKSIEDINSKTMPKNDIIVNNYMKAYHYINSPRYKKIMVSISGGSDSDIVLDICYRCDKDNKCEYVWFDTGLEYQATKDHLKYLENKYSITINPYKAIKPIPTACREYGQPFLSKFVSLCIGTLQNHEFKWEDEPLDVLLERYCVWNDKKQDYFGCKSALTWWCNGNGEKSRFNIKQNKWLKEFMIENPPSFKISHKCCNYAKKNVAYNLIKEFGYELNIVGIRKGEGGARASAYKNCFDEKEGKFDNYRPIFWYKNSDKEEYEKYFNIKHSRCYTEYGFKRTGCACCPFGFYGGLKEELKITKQYEPKLHKAICNVFHDSYEYSKQFEKFKKKIENK